MTANNDELTSTSAPSQHSSHQRHSSAPRELGVSRRSLWGRGLLRAGGQAITATARGLRSRPGDGTARR
ncbi:MAG: hypothetical protein ACLU38_05425 [Dysosmobacter sp.]